MINTERMILRRFDINDVEVFYRLNTIPKIIRYVGNAPLRSMEDAIEGLKNAPLHDYQKYGFGRFACVWKKSGQVIGFSGVKYIPEVNDVELGYRFLPEYWGMGLATESGLASIDYAKNELKLKRLIGLIHPENLAAAKVMTKLSFMLEGQARLSFMKDIALDRYVKTL